MNEKKRTNRHNRHTALVTSVGAGAGAIAGSAGCAATVAGMGFTSGGIAAGSTAAAMMAAEAIASGGGVAAGGTVATLQSIGAIGVFGAGGLGLALYTICAVSTAALVGGSVFGIMQLLPKPISREPDQRCGVVKGIWMVITEEGPGNVKYYSFVQESLAWEYFHRGCSLFLSRIIYNEHGKERACAGWNGWAHDTIRRAHEQSISTHCMGPLPVDFLRPRDVVAFYSPTSKRFIRMRGENIGVGDQKTWDETTHSSERFTVVDGDNGEVAFHCSEHNRFMRLLGHDVDARGGEKNADQLPPNWSSERFTLINAGSGLVALHNHTHNRFIRMYSKEVDAKGGPRDNDCLPNCWGAERFRVVVVGKIVN